MIKLAKAYDEINNLFSQKPFFPKPNELNDINLLLLQVHKATLENGEEVALKIQYPGVANSIDSDINNLVSVLSIGGIFPRGLYLDSFIKVCCKIIVKVGMIDL